MYPMNEDFGRARIQQFEQMIANAPPRGRGRPHRVRFALGRALIQSGSRLLSEEARVRVA
jgi:hypothetical protein